MIKMEKIIKGYLIVNYKTGKIEFRKRPLKNEPYYKIPIEFRLTIEIPEKPSYKIEKTITMSDVKLKEMFLDEL